MRGKNFHRTCNLTKRWRRTSKLTHTHLTTKNYRFSHSQDLIPPTERARSRFVLLDTPFYSAAKALAKRVLSCKRSRGTNTKTTTHRLFLGFSSIESKSQIK